MKFLEIFRFELAYQVRRPWPWLIFLVLVILDFLMTRDGSFAEALYSEFFLNSPFGIAKTTVFGGLVWLLSGAAIAGEAASRDLVTGMYPLIYTSPVSKAEYLGGRFLAAFVLNSFILLAVQLGILLAVYLPGVAPALIGPFRPSAFLASYFFIAVPNALFSTAIQFSLALRSGRPISAYFGSLLLFFMAFFVASLLLFNRGPGKLLDPIGVRFIWEDLSHLWTTVEKNWRMISLEGTILQNRLVWLAIGFLVGTYAFIRFRFAHPIAVNSPVMRLLNFTLAKPKHVDAYPTYQPDSLHHSQNTKRTPPVSFGFNMQLHQTLTLAWTSFRTIAWSWTGLAMLVFIPLLSVVIIIDQMESVGAPVVPLTSRVIGELTGALSAEMSRWVIIPGFIIFFAGELVWKERDAGVNEIADAMPGTEWPPLLGKFLGIVLILIVFQTFLTTSGILAQVLMNYHHFEIGLYLKTMFGLQLTEYILFAVVALVVHVIVNQKYIGHLVAIIVYMFIALLGTMLGIEHNLLIFGAGPGWSYTEMRGFGDSITPWLWFKLYWGAWSILLVVAARLLWFRGREMGLVSRMKAAHQRFDRQTLWLGGAASALIFGMGGFIFYNTNILNPYSNSADASARRALYEQRYGKFSGMPQPDLAATNVHVDVYPERRKTDIRGSHLFINHSSFAIDSILLATPSATAIQTKRISFDRAHTIAQDDPEYGHRLYVLEDPLRPGDTLRLGFEIHVQPRGFSNNGIDPSLTAAGSAFNNGWFPAIGYQRQRELVSAAARREYGLPARPVIASLYETEQREPATRGGGVSFEAVISTREDQFAVAPGSLQRSWTKNHRRYFHYKTSAPIGSEWNFFSANYAVRENEWSDSSGTQQVSIRIYHYPDHDRHLDGMMRGLKNSLEYYTAEFGPYPYNHLTVVEHPAAPGVGMHASAAMFYYGQSVPFWAPAEGGLDFPYAVVAHEMAHQWTLPYAFVEGAPFLSEGLAWYSAIQLVKVTQGEEQLQKLLSFMRLPYPHQPTRRGEPLLRALDPYMSYRKGPFAMHALSHYAGVASVNNAIRRLIEIHDQPGASAATTLDLYRELKTGTPDSLQYLLHDLFEVNTYWQLSTNDVTAVRVDNDTWKVTVDVTARKIVYDSAGVETEVPMDEWIPIGVFAENVSGNNELNAPLHLEKHRIRSGRQKISLTIRGVPFLAGIDPFHLLDWEEKENDDNIEKVKRRE